MLTEIDVDIYCPAAFVDDVAVKYVQFSEIEHN